MYYNIIYNTGKLRDYVCRKCLTSLNIQRDGEENSEIFFPRSKETDHFLGFFVFVSLFLYYTRAISLCPFAV